MNEETKSANDRWISLRSDAERADFIASGEAYFAGLVSPFIAADLVRAYRRLAGEAPQFDDDEKRLAELLDAVDWHEKDGTPPTLGTLKKRNGFEAAEVERLARRFPGKLALKDCRNPKGGPATKSVHRPACITSEPNLFSNLP